MTTGRDDPARDARRVLWETLDRAWAASRDDSGGATAQAALERSLRDLGAMAQRMLGALAWYANADGSEWRYATGDAHCVSEADRDGGARARAALEHGGERSTGVPTALDRLASWADGQDALDGSMASHAAALLAAHLALHMAPLQSFDLRPYRDAYDALERAARELGCASVGECAQRGGATAIRQMLALAQKRQP